MIGAIIGAVVCVAAFSIWAAKKPERLTAVRDWFLNVWNKITSLFKKKN